MIYEERIEELRKLFTEKGYDGYMISTQDEYLSEYAPEYAKRLEYLTGFDGSNGWAIILKNTVLFFTDSRYLSQAFQQLDDHLFEIFDQSILSKFVWADYVGEDEVIAYNPKLFTSGQINIFSNLDLRAKEQDLINNIWENRPNKPQSPVYDYSVDYAGETYLEKLSRCREEIKKHNAEALIITDPESVCWLFNIRASDINFSPLLLANAIITLEHAYIFSDINRFENLAKKNDITVLVEEKILSIIGNVEGKILYDERQCSVYINRLVKNKNSQSVNNPCMLWKACKNDIEIKHAVNAHMEDAVAVCELLSFIDNNDMSKLSEFDIGEKLTELRSKTKDYVMDSFPNICGFAENGAIVHYRAKKETAKYLSGDGLLLIDSGGQYLGATTDITRTVVLGQASVEQRKNYTNVLKGHIALSMAIFPEKITTGANLDILARQYLWQNGLDYGHGTGHGVGSFLSVHEGPQSISLFSNKVPLQKGMILSNEPGYYANNEYGIRIENLIYVKNSEYSNFLEFETLTLVPYDKNLIEFSMLETKEIEFLRLYYKKIDKKIFPLLSAEAKKWFKTQIDIF